MSSLNNTVNSISLERGRISTFAKFYRFVISTGDFGLCCHLLIVIWIDWYLSTSVYYVFVTFHLSSAIIYHLRHQVKVPEDFFSIMSDVYSHLQLDGNIYYS